MEFKFCPLQNRSHENDTISKNKMEFQFKNTGEDSMLPWTDYTPIPRYTGQRENLSSRSSGGARVLDQGGQFFSVGRQTSSFIGRPYRAPLAALIRAAGRQEAPLWGASAVRGANPINTSAAKHVRISDISCCAIASSLPRNELPK